MNPAARNQMAKRIGPGFWVDKAGALHISVPEILEATGMEDTEENRDLCFQMAKQMFGGPEREQHTRIFRCPKCNTRHLKLTDDALGTFQCLDCKATWLESELKPE